MNPAQQWWYMQQLKRKQSQLESDQKRVELLLERTASDANYLRLKRELEFIGTRLARVKRGLLY